MHLVSFFLPWYISPKAFFVQTQLNMAIEPFFLSQLARID